MALFLETIPPLYSTIPFIGILLSIAFFPLLAPKFWHKNFGKISLFWALLTAIFLIFYYKFLGIYLILYVIFTEYLSFIILLGSLYVVAGGILLKANLVGTPLINTLFLLLGTFLASFMGTTGASMLIIRPFLRVNSFRKERTFMVVFFIFLISNIGGSLTPLGDPPLFLGFLKGVPFFWTLNLFFPMCLVVSLLLIFYFFLDLYFYKKESPFKSKVTQVKLEGKPNFLFLIAIILTILLTGLINLGEIPLGKMPLSLQALLRDFLLLLIGFMSYFLTPNKIREENEFSWFPIKEVAIIFLGIFITMIPCQKILQAGEKGPLAFAILHLNNPMYYFWFTGILSAFLDNAPTYLVFLNLALGKFYPSLPEKEAILLLIQNYPKYLLGISMGAVFFGALTYIGNAPNFMVRSIAEELGTPMPSFLGYLIKFSIPILVPIFILVGIIFLK
ncbi:MAG: sodium:proton antiporter [Thermodesulfobacteriaceae bacterium]|nr:sodium:proton antiporter [Thermodesulfobacteriaceae bacterium]